jgi:hypothetical protein
MDNLLHLALRSFDHSPFAMADVHHCDPGETIYVLAALA